MTVEIAPIRSGGSSFRESALITFNNPPHREARRVACHAALCRALAFLEEYADVVAGRVVAVSPPPFVEGRGWATFLSGLSPLDLERAETDAAAFLQNAGGAPRSLRSFAAMASEVSRLERLGSEERFVPVRERFVKDRKSGQIEALVGILSGLAAEVGRVVDVGSGMGHLSRIASERWQRGALGLDWNERLLASATALAAGTRAEYRVIDALDGPLPLRKEDLVLGLHACGEVTDVALKAAGAVGARVAFVSCCLQKVRSGERRALSRLGADHNFVLSREVLGLSNLLGRAEGIEVAQAISLEAREARHALRLMLEARGVATLPGEEMRGVNRRRARRGLPTLAREVFAARGLVSPSDAELTRFEGTARVEFARMRRWAVPRTLVARAIECVVALDRAAFLEENGYSVRVVEAFSTALSPRNVALVGAPASSVAVRNWGESSAPRTP